MLELSHLNTQKNFFSQQIYLRGKDFDMEIYKPYHSLFSYRVTNINESPHSDNNIHDLVLDFCNISNMVYFVQYLIEDQYPKLDQ